MKKIYIAPEADLLCFRPVENLAINFDDIYNVSPPAYGKDGNGATISQLGDIKIDAKK